MRTSSPADMPLSDMSRTVTPIETDRSTVTRMAGIGHLLVYAVGALDLKGFLGDFLGDTQFKKVCVIAAIAMLFAQGVSAWATQERVLISDGYFNCAR